MASNIHACEVCASKNKFAKIFRLLTGLSCFAILTACGSGGGNDGAPGGSQPITADPVISGTFALGSGVAGKVDVLSANGISRSTTSAQTGAFSLSAAGLTSPYLLKGTASDGAVFYAVGTEPLSAGAKLTTNISQLTNLTVAGISPQGKPDLLWAQAAGDRGSTITARYEGYLAQMRTAVAPVAKSLGLPDTINFAKDVFIANGMGLDALLDNVQGRVLPASNDSTFVLASSRAPNLPTLWASSSTSVPLVQIASFAAPINVGEARTKIEKSYADYRTGAAQFDPAKADFAAIDRLSQALIAESQKPQPSYEKAMEIYRQLLVAMGFPASLASEIIKQMDLGDVDGMAELITSFFGAEGAKTLADIKSMTTEPVSVDLKSGVVTYKITQGGKVTFQTWSLQSLQGGAKTAKQDYSACLHPRLDPSTGNLTSAEQLIMNSVYINTCEFQVNYVSCIWSGRSSGCRSDNTSGAVASGQSTGIRDVVSGPLFDSREFVACQAPAKPVKTAVNSLTNPPYRMQWACI